MELTSLIEIWKWFRWIPPLILKHIFTKSRLSELVYIDVRPRGDSVRVCLGETSSFDIYLQIINMTPFEIELDRAEFDLNFSGVTIKNKHLKKSVIKAGQIYDLYISDGIDGSKAIVIDRMSKSGNASAIDVYCVFNCKLGQFVKECFHLGNVNVKYNGNLSKSDQGA
ncbi:hypothetical protein [Zhongshania sp. BJYM1]|uniref:hypothetical protein n=1 Tax=Zhongshania aquatica TaxID=2965069 RepID=UPI0022B416F4|nr:hypothetical protein [Marortus sp. BJYM1]